MTKQARRPKSQKGPSLQIGNHQRNVSINLTLFRRIILSILRELADYGQLDISIHLVSAADIARLNETFLRHRGPTDVLAFDYRVEQARSLPSPEAELFLCPDEAVLQARRFRTTWQNELTRYVIHGLLHLCGYDDSGSLVRRRMKREEGRLLRQIAGKFDLSGL
jgi:probable rRNA maturation factor